jgi:hypothetical protein
MPLASLWVGGLWSSHKLRQARERQEKKNIAEGVSFREPLPFGRRGNVRYLAVLDVTCCTGETGPPKGTRLQVAAVSVGAVIGPPPRAGP